MNTTENGFHANAPPTPLASSPRSAANLQPELYSAARLSGSSAATLNLSMTEDQPADPVLGARDKILSASSQRNTLEPSGENAAVEAYAAKRTVRTIPTWVYPLEEGDEDAEATTRLLPNRPISAQLAQHNHTPSMNSPYKIDTGPVDESRRGRTTADRISSSSRAASRWRTFATASAYPQTAPQGGERVTEEWLQEHGPDYERPWHAESESPEKGSSRLVGSKLQRKAWWQRFQHTILRNPMVPLVIRLTLWCFSLIAMALGVSIHDLSGNSKISQGPSTLIAITVDAVALVYILYITYDEYTGKPLGLRSAKAKMRLIFLDLFFIVFDSANLSLAFSALSDVQGPCQEGELNGILSPRDRRLCQRQTALASVLLIVLIAWLMTFSISVLRLVERVVQR